MISIVLVVVATLATTSAAALIAMTTALRSTTTEVAAAVESVRLAEEAEINLLLHARASDSIVQRDIESELRNVMMAAERYVTGDAERAVLMHAVGALEAYVREAHEPSATSAAVATAHTAAFAAIERLIDLNVEQARTTHAKAIRWDQTADVVGITVASAIIVITFALLLWLHRRFVRPWFALAHTMRRFAEGDRTVRANDVGPAEVLDMARSFNDMADAIATQRQAQAAFVGGVAHDLRTPLSAMRLAVDMISPTIQLPEPQLRRTVAVMARQLDQLERMLGDFMDMSQIEAGELDLRIGAHDIRGIVSDAVRLFTSADPSRDVRVSVPDHPTPVMCDDVRLGQVVTNLVSNAIKYSPRDTSIAVVVSDASGDATIEVVDQGPGIAREDQRRVFEPFRRVGDRRLATGTGLGLFNVKRIVEAHDGRIELESAPGRGCTFRVVLQLAHA